MIWSPSVSFLRSGEGLGLRKLEFGLSWDGRRVDCRTSGVKLPFLYPLDAELVDDCRSCGGDEAGVSGGLSSEWDRLNRNFLN